MAELAGKMESELTDDEANELLMLYEQIQKGTPKQVRRLRKRIRYSLFRIREGNTKFDSNQNFVFGLKKRVMAQFEPKMTLETFTFNWDIHPTDPLTILTPYDWADAGGKFEIVRDRDEQGVIRERRVCDPPAFTNQEM